MIQEKKIMKDKNEYGKNWKKEIIDEIVDSARMNPKYVETSMNYLIKKIETDKETKEFLLIIGINVDKPIDEVIRYIYERYRSYGKNEKSYMTIKVAGVRYSNFFHLLMDAIENKNKEKLTKVVDYNGNNMIGKEKCTVSEIDVTGLANSMVVTMNELEKRINMNESQLSTNDELREIRQERKWIINQMHEVVDSLNCSLGRLSRKLQENIGKEKVALVE